MRRLRIIPAFLLTAGIFLILSSCTDENPSPFGMVELSFSGTGNTSYNTIGRTASGRVNAAVEITDFQISIRDVVFKTDVDNDGLADDSTEVVFSGPYLLDLLNNASTLSQLIGTSEIPTGIYEELQFVLHKSTDVDIASPLYNRSIYVKGSINGTPFEMWHDTDENFDIKNSAGIIIDANGARLNVAFLVDQFMDVEVPIDLTMAIDGDGDGVIEINTNDDDGNKDLADAFKNNIKAAVAILEQ